MPLWRKGSVAQTACVAVVRVVLGVELCALACACDAANERRCSPRDSLRVNGSGDHVSLRLLALLVCSCVRFTCATSLCSLATLRCFACNDQKINAHNNFDEPRMLINTQHTHHDQRIGSTATQRNERKPLRTNACVQRNALRKTERSTTTQRGAPSHNSTQARTRVEARPCKSVRRAWASDQGHHAPDRRPMAHARRVLARSPCLHAMTGEGDPDPTTATELGASAG